VESHTGRIEIIPPIFVVSFTLFSPLNINGHMLSGVMAQEVTTAYNTRVLTLFYCLQISSIVFSYTSVLSRIASLCLSPCFYPSSSSFSFSSFTFSFIGVSPSFPSPFIVVFLSLIVIYFLLLSIFSLRFSSSLSSLLFSPHPCPIPIFFSFFVLCVSPSVPPGAHVRIIYIVMHIIFHLFPRVRVFSMRIFSSAINALI